MDRLGSTGLICLHRCKQLLELALPPSALRTDIDAEADEVINELNPLTEGEDVIVEDSNKLGTAHDLYAGE